MSLSKCEQNKIICIQLSNEKSGLKFICILIKRKIPVSPQLKHLTPSSITIKSVTLIDMTKHVHLPWSLKEYRILYIGLNSNDIHLFKSCRAEIIKIQILAIFYKTYGKYSKSIRRQGLTDVHRVVIILRAAPSNLLLNMTEDDTGWQISITC